MSKRCAWLALVALMSLFTPRPAAAQSSEPLKPYVVMILDTSGSMDAATGAGPPSCGGLDNRLNHAKCAINRIVNSYGDMVFALSRFRETPSGSFATSCDANGDIDGFGNDDCGPAASTALIAPVTARTSHAAQAARPPCAATTSSR